ncbi:type II toxin-antitoxin system VapB family antitoxin [Nocardia rhamnosiphila]|uniref:type II toxin-antitoxin system VapB family antitoxin n=1 Tax=Nocardia rhamnosiphila TaxID=426716 RepID=UPI0033CF05FA
MVFVRIEIDEEELESARTLGGHPTATEAVAEALRQYNQRLARDEQRLNRAAALRYYFEWQRTGISREPRPRTPRRSMPTSGDRVRQGGGFRNTGRRDARGAGRRGPCTRLTDAQ